MTASAFTLRNPLGQDVASTVTYDAQTKTAELRPQAALANGKSPN